LVGKTLLANISDQFINQLFW